MDRFKTLFRLLLGVFLVFQSSGTRAFQYQIDTTLELGQQEGMEVSKVGFLKAGSVIEIPDQFKVEKEDGIDFVQTLRNWEGAAQSGKVTSQSYELNSAGPDEKFYQIRVVKAAQGSVVPTELPYFFVTLHEPQKAILKPLETDLNIYGVISSSATEGAVCLSCHSSSGLSGVQSGVKSVSKAMTNLGLKSNVMMQGLTSKFSLGCEGFIKKNGKLGSWGEKLVSEMKKYPSFTSKNNKIERICPRFQEMDREEKYLAMTWIMTATADLESNCRERIATDPYYVKPPNGRAVGLFQMEERASLRVRRGQVCNGNMFMAANNIRCAVSIMSQLLGAGRGISSPTENYWQPLHKNDRKYKDFLARVKQYKACSRR